MVFCCVFFILFQETVEGQLAAWKSNGNGVPNDQKKGTQQIIHIELLVLQVSPIRTRMALPASLDKKEVPSVAPTVLTWVCLSSGNPGTRLKLEGIAPSSGNFPSLLFIDCLPFPQVQTRILHNLRFYLAFQVL